MKIKVTKICDKTCKSKYINAKCKYNTFVCTSLYE